MRRLRGPYRQPGCTSSVLPNTAWHYGVTLASPLRHSPEGAAAVRLARLDVAPPVVFRRVITGLDLPPVPLRCRRDDGPERRYRRRPGGRDHDVGRTTRHCSSVKRSIPARAILSAIASAFLLCVSGSSPVTYVSTRACTSLRPRCFRYRARKLRSSAVASRSSSLVMAGSSTGQASTARRHENLPVVVSGAGLSVAAGRVTSGACCPGQRPGASVGRLRLFHGTAARFFACKGSDGY